jgi:hypothetical protein
MAESKAWQSKNKLENFENIEAYLDVVVGKVQYPFSLSSSEKQRQVHKIPTITYNTHENTTFHYDHETKKYTKTFECCNIKTLFYSEGETLTDGKEILTYTPNPAILTNLYKHGQFSIARNKQKYLGSAGITIRRKTAKEDIKRGHLGNSAQREYKHARINGVTKNGTYILSKNEKGEIQRDKNKIVVCGNPKQVKTGEFKQEFPSHRERRKVPHTFEPNRYSEKHKRNRVEIVQQIIANRESQKHRGLMIRKPKPKKIKK